MAEKIGLYLSIDSITGGAKEPLYSGWIPIRSFSWTLASQATPLVSLDLQSVTFVAAPDVSSPVLMSKALGGDLLKSAQLDQIVHAGYRSTVFKADDVMVSSFQTGSDGFAFTLSLGKITLYPKTRGALDLSPQAQVTALINPGAYSGS